MGRSVECFRKSLYRIGTEEEGTKRSICASWRSIQGFFDLQPYSAGHPVTACQVRMSLWLVAESLQSSMPDCHDGALIIGV